MRTAITGVVAMVLSSAPATAYAGRTFYGWLYGTEVMPERGVEITNVIDERNGFGGAADIHWTTWGFSAEVGVTDQLTIAFPMDFVWRDSAATEPSFSFADFGIEARYRLVSSDLEEAPPFAPLIRAGVKRSVLQRDILIAEADLVASTTTPSGSVHALVDIGYRGEFLGDKMRHQIRPGAGVSFKIVGDFRLGAEVVASIDVDNKDNRHVVVGPNAAWTQGRFWISASFGIGVYQIDTAPRAVWGILF
ncbi:MAG: hypothetical protein ACKV2T_35075 [Kofleriaceae bacterium]